MAKLYVDIPNELDTSFRKAVFERKGMKKGNLNIAVEEALKLWIDQGK